MEEFEEYDVLFSENPYHQKEEKKKKSNSMKVYPAETDDMGLLLLQSSISSKEEEEEEEEKKKMVISVPIRIPSGNSILNRADDDCIFEETEEVEGKKRLLFVAPHLMVERRKSKRMAFSVCTGNGRTLKGRDLCRVRNSVLKMTGFIETC